MSRMDLAVCGYIRECEEIQIFNIPQEIIQICIKYVGHACDGTIDFDSYCKKFKHQDPAYKENYRRYWHLFVIDNSPVFCVIEPDKIRWYALNMATNEVELKNQVDIDFYEIDYPMYVNHSEIQKNEFYLLQPVETVYNDIKGWWELRLYKYDMGNNILSHVKTFHVKDYFTKEDTTISDRYESIRRFNWSRVTGDGKYIHTDASLRGTTDFMELMIISVETGECVFKDKFRSYQCNRVLRECLSLNKILLMGDKRICIVTLEDNKVKERKECLYPQRRERGTYRRNVVYFAKDKALSIVLEIFGSMATFIFN